MKFIRVWPWNITWDEVYFEVHTSHWGTWFLYHFTLPPLVIWLDDCAISHYCAIFHENCAISHLLFLLQKLTSRKLNCDWYDQDDWGFAEESTFDSRHLDKYPNNSMSSSTANSNVVLLCHIFSVPQYPLLDKIWNGTNLVRTCFSDKTQIKHHIVK